MRMQAKYRVNSDKSCNALRLEQFTHARVFKISSLKAHIEPGSRAWESPLAVLLLGFGVSTGQLLQSRNNANDDDNTNYMIKDYKALCAQESPLAGRTYDVEVPPTHCGHAEFVVLRSRFEESVRRSWGVRNHCQAFFPVCTGIYHLILGCASLCSRFVASTHSG